MSIRPRTQLMGRYVQYGCSYSAPDGWVNYDSSPSLLILRMPVVGPLLYRATGNAKVFSAGVAYGDIVKGLPEAAASCDAIFASHVLEHLSRSDCIVALRNTFLLLKPGGFFRTIVPSLESRARRYIADLENGRADANDRFMEACCLGSQYRPRSLASRFRKMYGASEHLWMYDAPSMIERLAAAGFTDIRRCDFGDNADPMFARVEERDRFFDRDLGAREVALEARRPIMNGE